MGLFEEIEAEARAIAAAETRATLERMFWEGDPTRHLADRETRRAMSEATGIPERILFEPLPPPLDRFSVRLPATPLTVTRAELEPIE